MAKGIKGTFTICGVEGCEAKSKARNLCDKHLSRQYRYGDVHFVQRVRHSGTEEERFWAKVNKTLDHWYWTASLNKGYGFFNTDNRKRRGAHQYAYQLLVGPIPEGYDIHHTCGVRNCVWPEHMELLSHAEHAARHAAEKVLPTHCPHGHEFTPENTGYFNSSRYCRECSRIKARKQHAKKREERKAELVRQMKQSPPQLVYERL